MNAMQHLIADLEVGFDIPAVPGMPETDQVVLVRRLLREGVVVPAARP